MTTKSYSYNKATKELSQSKELTTAEAIAYIYTPEQPNEAAETELRHSMINGFDCHLNESIQATNNIKASSAYPYNTDVAKELLQLLGLSETKETLSRAGNIVYGTNHYVDAKQTIKTHDNALAEGYISFHDITPDMDGKKAIMSGKSDDYYFAVKKENAPVTLVAKQDGESLRIGYRKPRMRTRYYTVAMDDEYFIKLV